MFFQKRRWAGRVIEKTGLSIWSPEATLLIELMMWGAKNMKAPGLGTPERILMVADGMFDNETASRKVARVLNIEHEAAQHLLHRLRVAARETASEYGYLKLVETMHRYGEPRKNQTSTPTQNNEHGRLLKRGKQNMGFWSNLRNSLHKSFELKRISRTLGRFGTAKWSSTKFIDLAWASMAASSEMEQAEEALFDLIENDALLSEIVRRHGASRDDLRNLYRNLCIKAGEWHRGHWVPASALAFGVTLDYLLSECVSGIRTPAHLTKDEIYNQWLDALFKVLVSFEKGRVGQIR